MSELLNLEFDGLPPTVNLMYRGLRGHRYKPKSVIAYQDYAVSKIREHWQGKEVFTGSAALYITFETNNRRRWDMDNRIKAFQDCLTLAGVLKDDTQINFLQAKREQSERIATVVRLLRYEG